MEATADLIRRHGVHATSISDIGAESGASTGSIYHHFGNKKKIIESLAADTLNWPIAALTAGNTEWTPIEIFDMAISTLQSVPDVGALILQLGAGAISDDTLGRTLFIQFRRFAGTIEVALQGWAVRNGIPRDELPGIVQVIGGLIAGYNVQFLLNHDFDAKAYRNRCVGMLSSLEHPAESCNTVGA